MRGRATSASCAISAKSNAVVTRRGGSLTEYDLEPKFRAMARPPAGRRPKLVTARTGDPAAGAGGGVRPAGGQSGLSVVAGNEKRLLREALIKSRGNRLRAAEFMGISRRTLHRKLAQWPELDVTDK